MYTCGTRCLVLYDSISLEKVEKTVSTYTSYVKLSSGIPWNIPQVTRIFSVCITILYHAIEKTVTNTIAVIGVEPTAKYSSCLETHTNESKASIQSRTEPFASFACETTDNCDKSH